MYWRRRFDFAYELFQQPTVYSSAITATFSYDANGNQTAAAGSSLSRLVTYTSYNKPASITQSALTLCPLPAADPPHAALRRAGNLAEESDGRAAQRRLVAGL